MPVSSLEEACRAVGLDYGSLGPVELLRSTGDGEVYRLRTEESCGRSQRVSDESSRDRSQILKWFSNASSAREVRCYALLQDLGVPTPRVLATSERVLLLEDLSESNVWRLAEEHDCARAEVGTAVAGWYQLLHAAGDALRERASGPPSWLTWEIDALTPDAVLDAGQSLGAGGTQFWRWAATVIDPVKATIHAQPYTLTYNDFYWTNLAVSRSGAAPVFALVFDYHLLGLGMRYSDWRNVSGSLSEPARSAFEQAYGPISELEQLLDAATADLYSLVVASRRPAFPRWARASMERVRSGQVEADLRRALEVTGAL